MPRISHNWLHFIQRSEKKQKQVIRDSTWIMGLPRISTSGLPRNRVEAKRAGMIPMTRLRNFPDLRKYLWAPKATATADPATRAWTSHDFVELDDGGDDELHIGIALFQLQETRGEDL